MSVDDVRQRIDAIDDKLLDLLDERAKLAREAGRAKRQDARAMHDPEREGAVLERAEARLASRPDPVFPASGVRSVFREIMSACLSVEEVISVSYLGPPGTFTHMAAHGAFGLAARYVESTTILGVFDAVARGATNYGVVPIENSTEGGVTFTLDSLADSEVTIRGELVLDVAQCLIARHDDIGRIERVFSHPQALAQCREWLAKHLPRAQLVVTPSTATAARDAARDDASAAVASRLAAELTGLRVIREKIQDRAENATRFVILALDDAPPSGADRTSVVFATPDSQGALRRVLQIFDEEGINLSRIESRPRRGEMWQYVFFTDFEGHRVDLNVTRALARLQAQCHMVKVLGSYPRAKRSMPPSDESLATYE
jgi:chorismate mutase / prephenate dehydratase